jgi:hypothetical protein
MVDQKSSGYWISSGREAPILWPGLSPDLNHLNYFCGDILKPRSMTV